MDIFSVLEIKFSNLVGAEVLQALHQGRIEDEHLQIIRTLIQSVGGHRLDAVYEISEDEIVNDAYGFARAFKLLLKSDVDISQSIESLKKSPLVESVKPISISTTSLDSL